MTESKNRQWILNARPAGKMTGEEFRWNEASIPKPSDGQVLVRNLWLSFDPAQRIWMSRDSYMPKVPLGDVMRSLAVGQVLESRRPELKLGDLVRGSFGWQDYVATDEKSSSGSTNSSRLASQPRVEPVRPQRPDSVFRDNGDRPGQSR
jgi:NADPH-dependent curcumin reductase CurA